MELKDGLYIAAILLVFIIGIASGGIDSLDEFCSTNGKVLYRLNGDWTCANASTTTNNFNNSNNTYITSGSGFFAIEGGYIQPNTTATGGVMQLNATQGRFHSLLTNGLFDFGGSAFFDFTNADASRTCGAPDSLGDVSCTTISITESQISNLQAYITAASLSPYLKNNTPIQVSQFNNTGEITKIGKRLRIGGNYSASPADPSIGEADIMIVDNGITPTLRIRYNMNGVMKVADVALA